MNKRPFSHSLPHLFIFCVFFGARDSGLMYSRQMTCHEATCPAPRSFIFRLIEENSLFWLLPGFLFLLYFLCLDLKKKRNKAMNEMVLSVGVL